MIYFITAREMGRVKIGFSDQPAQRYNKMQADSPAQLKLERLCEGDRDHEASLHARFAAYRVRGEWFELSGAIEEFMRELPAPAPPKREPGLGATIAESMGISRSYCSMLLTGKRQAPLNLAVQTFIRTGHKFPRIADSDDDEIRSIARFCPWPRPDRTTEAA